MSKYKVYVIDKQDGNESENIIEVRKNTSIKTVILKGLEKHIDDFAADPLEFLKEIKYLHKESENEMEFIEVLKNDLDLIIGIGDLNNHTYYNEVLETHTNSISEGLRSYKNAWKDQLSEKDGIKDFNDYRPSDDILIEHGNELMKEILDEWEIEN